MDQGLVRLFDATPIWLVGVLVLTAMTATAAIGRVIARFGDDRAGDPSSGAESFIVSGVLGLLALLVGFTFSLSVERYETRRGLVLEEANAIGTAYLRAQLLGEPHRGRVSEILVDYTGNRVALGQARAGRAPALVRANDRLLTDLWTEVVAAYPGIRDSEFAGSFLESVNTVIDLDAARKVARDAHVPPTVFLLLFVYQISSAGVLGYVVSNVRSIVLAGMLFSLFTLAMLLVIDIDRPLGGAVTESQRPMEMLQATLKAQPPAAFDRRQDAPYVTGR